MKKYIYYGSSKPDTTIIYIHGGGYVMGDQSDLPFVISNYIITNNLALITIDYPLAPQSSVAQTQQYVEGLINDLIRTFNIESYLVMGRSSGANLTLGLNPQQLHIQPLGLISFYGYFSNDLEWMKLPINNLDYPADTELINKIAKEEMTYTRSIASAYPYYYSLRKNGLWPSTIGMIKQDPLWDPNTAVFIAHSIFDPDVPYRAAIAISKYFPNHTLHTSTSKAHAFDQTIDENDKLISDLNTFIKKIKL